MATDFAQERRWKVAAAKKVGLGHRQSQFSGSLGRCYGQNVLYMAGLPAPVSKGFLDS